MPINRKWFTFDDPTDLAPKNPGAYELGDAKYVVVYIGSSDKSIRSRLLSHRKMKRFMKVKYFRFKEVKLPEDAKKLERKLCDVFKKEHNGKRPRLMRREPPTKKSSFLW